MAIVKFKEKDNYLYVEIDGDIKYEGFKKDALFMSNSKRYTVNGRILPDFIGSTYIWSLYDGVAKTFTDTTFASAIEFEDWYCTTTGKSSGGQSSGTTAGYTKAQDNLLLGKKINKPVSKTQGFIATVDVTGNDIEWIAPSSGVDAGEPWKANTDYKSGESFTHTVTQTTAVDVNSDPIEANKLKTFAYSVDITSGASTTLAEIAKWEQISGGSASVTPRTTFQTTPTDTDILSEKLVKDSLDLKEDKINKSITIRPIGTADDNKYVTEKAIRTAIDVLPKTFIGLTDTPAIYNTALDILRVNASKNAIEAVKLSATLVAYDNTVSTLPANPTTTQLAIEALKSLIDNQPIQTAVADIAGRDALGNPSNGSIVHVQDASADPNVVTGWAKYQRIGGAWELYISQDGLSIIALTPAQLADITNIIEGTITPKKLWDREQSLKANDGDIVSGTDILAKPHTSEQIHKEVRALQRIYTLTKFNPAYAGYGDQSVTMGGVKHVLGSDGNIYEATQDSVPVGTDPVGNDGTSWKSKSDIVFFDTYAEANVATVQPNSIIIVGKGTNYAATFYYSGSTPKVFAANDVEITKLSGKFVRKEVWKPLTSYLQNDETIAISPSGVTQGQPRIYKANLDRNNTVANFDATELTNWTDVGGVQLNEHGGVLKYLTGTQFTVDALSVEAYRPTFFESMDGAENGCIINANVTFNKKVYLDGVLATSPVTVTAKKFMVYRDYENVNAINGETRIITFSGEYIWADLTWIRPTRQGGARTEVITVADSNSINAITYDVRNAEGVITEQSWDATTFVYTSNAFYGAGGNDTYQETKNGYVTTFIKVSPTEYHIISLLGVDFQEIRRIRINGEVINPVDGETHVKQSSESAVGTDLHYSSSFRTARGVAQTLPALGYTLSYGGMTVLQLSLANTVDDTNNLIVGNTWKVKQSGRYVLSGSLDLEYNDAVAIVIGKNSTQYKRMHYDPSGSARNTLDSLNVDLGMLVKDDVIDIRVANHSSTTAIKNWMLTLSQKPAKTTLIIQPDDMAVDTAGMVDGDLFKFDGSKLVKADPSMALLASNVHTGNDIAIPDWVNYVSVSFHDNRGFIERRVTNTYTRTDFQTWGGETVQYNLPEGNSNILYDFKGIWKPAVKAIRVLDSHSNQSDVYGSVTIIGYK